MGKLIEIPEVPSLACGLNAVAGEQYEDFEPLPIITDFGKL